MSGSPPQMLTMGAPHSSTAARHSATDSFSLMVEEYSRIRPQPVQVRLQACNGSSISTRGKRFSPDSFLRAIYPPIEVARLRGKRMPVSFSVFGDGGRFAALTVDRLPRTRGRRKTRQGHEWEIKGVHVIF